MIPKIIHYCWFGKNPKSEIINKCIESWKKYCPDYKIIEWNEDNFDVSQNSYVKKAYEKKKWAFVSDYVRLKVVYDFGGVYLDTDVLLHNKIDELLQYECWLAQEDIRYISTGLGFGAIKNHVLIHKLMEAYELSEFEGIVNSIKDTEVVEREYPRWKKSEKSMMLDDTIFIVGLRDYSRYAHHLATVSWKDEKIRNKRNKEIKLEMEDSIKSRVYKWKKRLTYRIKRFLRSEKIAGIFKGTKIEKLYLIVVYDFLEQGFAWLIKNMLRKIKSNNKK